MSRRLRRQRPALGDMISRVAAPVGEKLDRFAGWDRLPPRLGVFALIGVRQRLRERNLYDTRRAAPVAEPPSQARTIDGRRNDPADADMGAVGTPFGRNAPPVIEDERTLERPSPLEVSNTLLTREAFFPAESINLLAAAWLQFEVHDWFAHRQDQSHELMTAEVADDAHTEPVPLMRDFAVEGSYAPFISDQTHWWDASQLYGARPAFEQEMRDGDGRVKEGDELLEVMERATIASIDEGGGTTPAVPNLWVGSALFHLLFASEHNEICDKLRREYPQQARDDDWLYQKARLINAAVMAKIHTVEWTPAIIAHPTTVRAVKATWFGLLGDLNRRLGGRFSGDEVLTGIPGSRQRHDGVPFSLTEEFVAVYKMHQLIPDEVVFYRVADRSEISRWDFAQLAIERDHADRPRQRLEGVESLANLIYSLAIAHPGEITLHNYPKFLQGFRPLDRGGTINLGEVDIRRTRETGVPRYNNFRRLFRLEPATSFHEIANGNPMWAREIREVYDDRLEDVDLLIGMFAERKPKGFAFSDSAFRVFVLMAARRLRSDRFFTSDYRPEVYTPAGLAWIERATMSDLLVRHHPELEPVLSNVDNPFQPWH